MPTSLEGIARPQEMIRTADQGVDAEFLDGETLYRRVSPEDIDEYEPGKLRVITTAWSPAHNLSVVRQKYGAPDHARWDSATDPQNPPGFVPQLWRDWYVVGIRVVDIPKALQSPGVGGVEYRFAPTHVPFDDLYSHSEIQTSKGAELLVRQNKFKSEEVKAQYRGALSNAAVVVLKPEQVDAAPPGAPADQV